MIKINWLTANTTKTPEPLAMVMQWSALKLFYRQHMAYARVSRKESVAVTYQHSPIEPDIDCNKSPLIIAAVRVKTVGQYQLVSGLLVHPLHRGQHLAAQILQFITPTLLNQKCFLFTHPSLQSVYLAHDFCLVPSHKIDALPAEITQLHQRYHSDSRPLIIMQYTTHMR